jgi:hypothetical protein
LWRKQLSSISHMMPAPVASIPPSWSGFCSNFPPHISLRNWKRSMTVCIDRLVRAQVLVTDVSMVHRTTTCSHLARGTFVFSKMEPVFTDILECFRAHLPLLHLQLNFSWSSGLSTNSMGCWQW